MLDLSSVTVAKNDSIISVLAKIDSNKQGFVIVIDGGAVCGVLTDGDVRRALIKGYSVHDSISEIYKKDAKTVTITDGFDRVIEYFKREEIRFLPIVDENNVLKNVITKGQMHALLLQDIYPELLFDFSAIDVDTVNHEIYHRPWGYYKTTVLNEYFQAKIISVKPGGKLSLQSHNHREEYWIVVHGTGKVQLDDSFREVNCGSNVFIPKGCRHRLENIDKKESLIITEVQIGDYFGEDDIIRYEDVYGRV